MLEMKKYLSIWLALFLFFNLPAQNPYTRFKKLPESSPLNKESIFDIIQDRKGFMWFATKNGIYKYDGYEYTQYTESDLDSTALNYKYVNHLTEDREKPIIWVGTMLGLEKFDLLTETFTHYGLNPQGKEGIPGIGDLSNLTQSEDGLLWYGAQDRNGFIVFDPKTETHKRYTFIGDKGLNKKIGWVTKIHIDRNGYIWFASLSTSGIYRLNVNTDSIELIYSNRGPFKGIYLTSNPKGDIYFYDPNEGVFTIDLESGTITKLQIDLEGFAEKTKARNWFDKLSGKMYIDSKNKLWFGTISDLAINIDLNSYKIQAFHYNPLVKWSINEPKVESYYEDSDGRLWIGHWIGLDLIDPYYSKFNLIPIELHPDNPIKNPPLTSIWQDNLENMWVASLANGINKIDLNNGAQDILYKNSSPTKEPFENLIEFAIPYDDYKILYRTWQGLLVKYDKRSRKYKTFPKIGRYQTEEGTQIWQIDDKALAFVKYAKPDSIVVINLKTKNFYSIASILNEKGEQFYPRLIDSNGFIWGDLYQGIKRGIVRYNPSDRTFKNYTKDFQEIFNQRLGKIYDFVEDKKGDLWFSTAHKGLFYIKTLSDDEIEVRNYNEGNSNIISNQVRSIQEDKEGNIWFNTEQGISRFNPQNEEFFFYDYEACGILFGNINPSSYQDSNGNLYFGGIKAISIFNPDSLIINTNPPSIHFTSFSINNVEVPIRNTPEDTFSSDISLEKHINFTKEITLPYDKNGFSLSYSVLGYTRPNDNTFAYKLENFHKDWIYTNATDRTVNLTNIPPGNYTFRIKGADINGTWNEQGASIAITILTPWWQSLWAYLFYFVAFVAVLWAFINWRTQQSRKRLAKSEELNDRLLQVDQLKDQFLANTSHELRTPLHGMVGLAEAMFEKADEEDKDNLGMLVASGKRLSSLVNDLLDFSKVKNHDLQLSLKALGLRPIVDLVLQSCKPFLGTKTVEFVNEIPTDLPPIYADENRLQQILYNLIGNAIKFTESGQIKVGISRLENESNELITLFIQDTGIGIPKEKQAAIFQAFEQADGSTAREYGGTGLGLSITKQLIELHGGKIWLESDSGKGSSFFFSLPKADAANISRISATPPKTAIESSLFIPPKSIEAKAKPQTTSIAVKGDHIRILLVDDEPINHQVIKNYFDGGEIYLRSVMSGHEALEVIQKEPQFDLILLDIMMPRMNGYEVCREIRKQYLASEMPVIMLTAKNQISDLVQGLETGANDYIAKPFSKDEFLARIKTHVNLHKIHSATHKFVPKDFLRSIDRDNITEVRLGDQKEQNVTVFFSDIRSYTSLSESMTPEENFKFVNAYAGRMGPIIRENKGFVNQYLGDGIMGIFQQKPEDALKAAIEMQREITEYNLQRVEQGRKKIEVGMGMHAGSLIMGVIGDEERNDSATISDTVNTASRMEGLTKHFGARIILSETVYQALENKDAYTLRYLGLVQVKGKDQPIGIYECLDAFPIENLKKLKESLPIFEEGMQEYFSKNFEASAVAFRKVLRIIPEDKTTQLYMTRCASYMVVGVPQEWAGVELMEKK